MNNLLKHLKQDLQRHKVKVKLPGEKRVRTFFLILVTAETDIITDIRETYLELVNVGQLDTARTVFSGRRFNTYGVMVDKNGDMVFAFNRAFADYDFRSHQIVIKDLDKVLKNPPPEPVLGPVDMIDLDKRLSELEEKVGRVPPHRHVNLSNVTFKYAAPTPRQSLKSEK